MGVNKAEAAGPPGVWATSEGGESSDGEGAAAAAVAAIIDESVAAAVVLVLRFGVSGMHTMD